MVLRGMQPAGRALRTRRCTPRQPLFPCLFAKPRRTIATTPPPYSPSSNVPRLARPSFWKAMVPTFLRPTPRPPPSSISSVRPAHARSTDWNPATFFIIIFLLIGSQAIQMIALRSEYATVSRQARARIGLLREVIERVQKGEDVDVEGLLGTGNEAKELEWEEVLREIEREDALWQSKVKKRRKRKATEEEERAGNRASTDEEGSVAEPERQEAEERSVGKEKEEKDYY